MMAISKLAELQILEYLRNESSMDGSEIMTFTRKMRVKGVFKR